ncbi:MAG TPA: TnsA endonuclease N-terminal domain-containing protein [Azonexus sp.]|nr:TnsA endonuclease N-terminal domain-containing protein [Azonexus sp.]
MERDAVYHFEFSPGVLAYREQPEVISYWNGNAFREYYPDFLLELAGGTQVRIEVKPAAKLEKPVLTEKYRHIARHYQERGQAFRMVTEHQVRTEPLLGNLRLLQRIRRKPADMFEILSRLPELQAGIRLPFAVVEARIGRDTLLALIAHGVLRCDLRANLAGTNPISLSQGADDDTVLL